MIGLDSNVLARYYVQDRSDAEADRQHAAARRLIESGRPLMVCKTVLLELEWVMRGYYRFTPTDIAAAMNHLLSLPHVDIEGRATIEQRLPMRPAVWIWPMRYTLRVTTRARAWRPSMTNGSRDVRSDSD